MIVIAKALGVLLFMFVCGVVGVLYDWWLSWRKYENK